jgi:hypothetical protein
MRSFTSLACRRCIEVGDKLLLLRERTTKRGYPQLARFSTIDIKSGGWDRLDLGGPWFSGHRRPAYRRSIHDHRSWGDETLDYR